MEEVMDKAEGLYEKCRVLINLLAMSRVEMCDSDREAVVDMLGFFFGELGEVIGILKK